MPKRSAETPNRANPRGPKQTGYEDAGQKVAQLTGQSARGVGTQQLISGSSGAAVLCSTSLQDGPTLVVGNHRNEVSGVALATSSAPKARIIRPIIRETI